MIYLPKNKTSLKAVVKELLAEVESVELDQLRADVDQDELPARPGRP